MAGASTGMEMMVLGRVSWGGRGILGIKNSS